MRFQAYFAPAIKILLYIIAVILLGGTIVGILFFCKVPIDLTINQATLLVSVCPLCAIVDLLFATLHYKVDSKCLRLYVGFIDIFGGKVGIDKILNIVFDNGKMYISYLSGKGMDPIISAIVINPKRYIEMKDLLISKNPKIVFYDAQNDTSVSK